MRMCDHAVDFSPHLKERMMTPEQRLERVERILTLFVNAGRRVRTQAREQDERISIIIKTQLETEEIMKGLALGPSEDQSRNG
jgi:hypothetical protein